MIKSLGCILIVCRSSHIVPLAKRVITRLGFSNIRGTSAAGDGLYRVIRELKPMVIFMEADFYKTATPYMLGQMLKAMPYLKVAVFGLSAYPEEKETLFIFHEALGYINLQDGMAEFYHGLRLLVNGKPYTPRRVRKAIMALKKYPVIRLNDSEREDEVLRLLADGYTTREIAGTLQVSDATVERHKVNMFARYHARNTQEAVKAGVVLKKISYG
jgi:DNA-binding NarL/FixJ family response regulator